MPKPEQTARTDRILQAIRDFMREDRKPPEDAKPDSPMRPRAEKRLTFPTRKRKLLP